MTTTMTFPRTRPQQAASIYAQQTTAQQIGGIDISSFMILMLPIMIIGMMGKMISGAFGKYKEPVTATATGTFKKGR
jgi:hypothetical protein